MKKVLLIATLLTLALASIAFSAVHPVDACLNYLDASDYDRALTSGEEAVRKYPQNFDAYVCLGSAYFEKGKFTNAFDEFKKAEKLAKSLEQLRVAYNWLGATYSKMGDIDNELYYKNKELSIAKQQGNKFNYATSLNNIGETYRKKSEFDKALVYYQQALTLADDKNKSATYNNIALIYKEIKDYAKAIDYIKKAISINEKNGNYHGVALNKINLADSYRMAKNLSLAKQYIVESCAMLQKLGDKYGEAQSYETAAFINLDEGKLAFFYENTRKAHDLYTSIGAKNKADEITYWILTVGSEDHSKIKKSSNQ